MDLNSEISTNSINGAEKREPLGLPVNQIKFVVFRSFKILKIYFMHKMEILNNYFDGLNATGWIGFLFLSGHFTQNLNEINKAVVDL